MSQLEGSTSKIHQLLNKKNDLFQQLAEIETSIAYLDYEIAKIKRECTHEPVIKRKRAVWVLVDGRGEFAEVEENYCSDCLERWED